jgi:hypothetical protein
MSDQILRLKDELNKKLASELDFEKDVKQKAIEKIYQYEEKKPSFLFQKIMSSVVLTAALVLLALFTVDQLSTSDTVFEKSASQSSLDGTFTYRDPEFGFQLEMPAYIEHHLRTFDSENGRTFYFIDDNGPEQLLFHLDIFQKSGTTENLDIPNRKLIRETEHYAYFVSDISENIKINSPSYSDAESKLLERFAVDFPAALLSFKPKADSQFGWSVKSVESHQAQVAQAVVQAKLLLEKEYPSDIVELESQGYQQFLDEVTPYEVNKIKMKMIVGIHTKSDDAQVKEELNHYIATYELIDAEWEKVEWRKIEK